MTEPAAPPPTTGSKPPPPGEAPPGVSEKKVPEAKDLTGPKGDPAEGKR